MAELLIENLHKRYGPVKAIDDVNIHVADGEFVSLLGPSGCGKSTTLGVIAGLEEATGGEVLLDGVPVTGPGRERGMVFQSYTLFPWLTVEQNVQFSDRLRANAGRSGERQ